MKQIYLSVVIPAYNEGTNIRLGALDKVLRYLEHQTYAWEVIVVNDGSTDETKQLLEEFTRANKGFRLIDNPHQGKAATVMTGMLQAQGDIILFTDLDQATPITMLERVLPWFSRGFDVVIGSREGRRQGAPLLRLVMARGFMILRSLVLGLHGIKDTQCGFKAFRRGVVRDIFNRLKLYSGGQHASGAMVTAGFDIEVLFIAKRLGYKIKEVPVEWHYVETRRVNPLKDSWQGFEDIVHIRANAMRGQYEET
ncbi:glycosyltransferase [Candidatus Gottesmanbacteria bacterium]|nr:glycosyltransferase [Candidatus Gottesmanbacteria bacterium]